GTAAMTFGGSTYDQSDAGTGDRYYHRFSPSLSLNYRKNKWNLFGSYSYFQRTYFSVFQVERFIGAEIYDQTNYTPFDVGAHNYSFGADFFVTGKTTIGVVFGGFDRSSESRAGNATEVITQGQNQPDGAFITLN